MKKDRDIPRLFIEDLDLKGKKVLMRVDFNVPLDNERQVVDATRIEAALPSIEYVLKQGASLILMSHLGRPHDMVNKALSLAPCAQVLSAILQKKVQLAPDCIGFEVEQKVRALVPGDVLLLENLRFHRGEEHPEEDPTFAKKLASYADCYVNDAFGTAHRKHSSTYTVAKYFPGKAAAGYLMEKEIQFLGKRVQNPEQPFYALIGGAKISSKIGVLKALLEKVDLLLIGGAMAYTFLKAQKFQIGDSLVENDQLTTAQEILDLAQKKGVPLLLPVDFVIAKECSSAAVTQVVDSAQGIPSGFQGYDIGPKTRDLFISRLKGAKTLLWNGPLGVYELDNFAQGTVTLAQFIASLPAITIVAGGDSIAALNALDLADKVTHLSTGGGATLEYIELGSLPGIEALSEKSGLPL